MSAIEYDTKYSARSGFQVACSTLSPVSSLDAVWKSCGKPLRPSLQIHSPETPWLIVLPTLVVQVRVDPSKSDGSQHTHLELWVEVCKLSDDTRMSYSPRPNLDDHEFNIHDCSTFDLGVAILFQICMLVFHFPSPIPHLTSYRHSALALIQSTSSGACLAIVS